MATDNASIYKKYGLTETGEKKISTTPASGNAAIYAKYGLSENGEKQGATQSAPASAVTPTQAAQNSDAPASSGYTPARNIIDQLDRQQAHQQALTTERADELDKQNVESATRAQNSNSGGFLGTLRRVGQGILSGLTRRGANYAADAAVVADNQGGTAMRGVYQDQVDTLNRQIEALENTLNDPTMTERDILETQEALRIAREQLGIYSNAVRSNENTAAGVYETVDAANRYAQQKAEQSVAGTSGLGRAALSLVPGLTELGLDVGASALVPLGNPADRLGLGLITRGLGAAGSSVTDYRYRSGEDYNPVTAANRGLIAGGGVLAGSLASNAVNNGVLMLLKNKGLQNNVIPAVLQNGLAATAYTGGDVAMRELARATTEDDYTPDLSQIGGEAASAFAFGVITGFINVAATSGRNKAYMRELNSTVQERYEYAKSIIENPAATAEQRAAGASSVMDAIDQLRYALDDMQVVGAAGEVKDIQKFLLSVYGEMLPYATQSAGSLGAPTGPLAPVTPPTTPTTVRQPAQPEPPVVPQAPAPAQTAPATAGMAAASVQRTPEITPTPTPPPAPASVAQPVEPPEGNLTAEATKPATAQKTGNTEHIENGGITNGTAEQTVHLRDGSERADGEDSGRQVRELEEGAGRDQSRRETGKPRDREAARLVLGKEVTTASLGIGRGSKTDKIRLIAKGETASMRSAKALAKEHGLRAVFYAGNNLTIGGERVRGYVSGDRVFVRADHPQFTADQLMRHEVGHDMIAKGEVDLANVRERVEQIVGSGSMQDVADAYAAAYEDGNLTPEQIFEEIVCDSLGDMNIFEQDLPALGERFGGFLKTLKGVTEESRKTARGPPAANADGKASVETTTENKPFVNVTADILKDVPESDWVKTVKDNLKEKFPNGVTVGNNQINIDRATRKEMTFSRYMQWLYNNDAQAWSDKLRATNNADEILQATTDWIDTGLNHPRRDNIADFASGDVLMRIGENDYAARVVVGTEADGYMRLYDVLDLQPTRFTAKETGAVKAANPSPGTDRKPATVSTEASPQRITHKTGSEALGRETSTNSVRDNSEDVNGKNSREAASLEALREENDALREQVNELREAKQEAAKAAGRAEYWKGQTKRTEAATLRKDDVDRLARSLVNGYSSTANAAEISADLMAAGNYLVRGGDESGELSYEGLKERVYPIAREIVQGASELRNGEDMDVYRDVKSLLGRKMSLSASDASGIADFKDWRKRNRGKVNIAIGGDGLPVDVAYAELSDSYPWLFPAEITNPTDQALQMVDALDSLAPIYENPYSYHMAEATEYCANEIIDALISEDVRQTPPTFADRQAAKLDEAKAHGREQVAKLREQKNARIEEIKRQGRERAREAVKRERDRRKEQVKVLKEHNAEVRERGREGRKARELRRKILKHAKDMSAELLRPTDKRHIPEQLRGPVARVLEAINLESGTETVYGTDARYHRVKAGSDPFGEATKRTQAFAALKKAYSEVAGELVIDPDLMGDGVTPGLFDDVLAMADKRIADMNSEELTTIWQALKAIEASVRTANKMFRLARAATITEFADELRRDNQGKKTKMQIVGAGGKAQQLISVDMLTPEAYFHRFGETGDALFRELRDAQDSFTLQMKEAAAFTDTLLDGYNVRKAERTLHTVTLGGEQVQMSTAQLMELYNLAQRRQALDHIMTGGTMPERVKKGLKEIVRPEPLRGITWEEIADAVSLLDAEDVRIAEGLQEFVSTTTSEHGNDASMEVYGYKKFTEPRYWPIRSNKQEVKSSVETDTQVTSPANYGFTKSVKPNANTSVLVGSVFDTFVDHVAQMATYSAYLAAMEDVNRVRNYQFRDGQGNRTGTVKGIIDTVHGRGGSAYLQTLMSQLAVGVRGKNSGTEYMGGLVGNYKGSAIGANLRVIAQQPTAILRAMDMIDPQYLLAGAARPMKGWEKALKYAPIAQWKDWGYFDVAAGRQMKDVLFNSESALQKANNALMAPAGWADSVAWGQLWNACELETKAKHKELSVGTKAYYDHVAARFAEIIDRTQVVDGILQRSQVMRSSDGLAKMATSFMAEPTKQYNMLLSSAYDVWAAQEPKERNKARRRLARTVFALLLSFAANAGAQSLIDAMRDDDRDHKYWERFFKAYPENFKDALNVAEYIPWAKDVASLSQGYDVGRMDMETISKVILAAQNAEKALNGEGKRTTVNAIATLFAEASRLFGSPAANIKRDVLAALNSYAVETDNYIMEYEMDKVLYRVDEPNNRSLFVDTLYRAYGNDQEQYKILYRKMVEDGFPEDKIRNAMENRMKKSEGVESVKDLGERYLAPEAQTVYDETLSRMQRSSVWRGASVEQREKAEGLLYDLSAGGSAGDKLREKINGGAGYGLDSAEYILYRLALSMTDEPTESGKYGTYTNAEVEAAIRMVPNLTDAERDYLWTAQGKNAKSAPKW